jgi:hypothetical protein
MQRFWWPVMQSDIFWFVRTCHICQTRQTAKVLIPPSVIAPAPIFTKIYVDTMHMPASGGYKYIVQGRCSLTAWVEFRKLAKENAVSLAKWLFEDIICRWGTLREIVTDNGKAFLVALAVLSKQYGINHIRISGYNSRANGIAERSHYDVRESLFKVADGEKDKWSPGTHSVFWAERVTTRRRMGCSPFFATTGAQPLLPLDFIEATYLAPPPDSILSTTDLITRRAITLQKREEQLEELHSKVFEARRKAAERFLEKHEATIKDYDFKKGDLVLLRNSRIEKSHDRKMKPRYVGPLVVITRNKPKGGYVLSEIDGSVIHKPIAAFRVIPYLPRKHIEVPDHVLDIPAERIKQLEDTEDVEE